jgi:gluconokinase
MNVPNLRSPHDKVGGIHYFGRMLDKIRLHEAGTLPGEYHANLGSGFDARCTSFLWIDYAALVERAKKGGTDEELLEWAFAQGRKPSDEEIEVWNGFMSKRGWKDEATPILERRLREAGAEHRADIQTMFDYIDFDEARAPHPVQSTS